MPDIRIDSTDAPTDVVTYWRARAEKAEAALDEAMDFQRTAFRTIRDLHGDVMYLRHRCARAERDAGQPDAGSRDGERVAMAAAREG